MPTPLAWLRFFVRVLWGLVEWAEGAWERWRERAD